MGKFIDLPEDIKTGDKILVRDSEREMWYPRLYIAQLGDKVYAVADEREAYACTYSRAKLPKTDWNEIAINTAVRYWDEGGVKHEGYLVAVINGVPFCSPMPVEKFTQEGSDENGGYTVQSWEHVEIIKED